MNRQTRPVKQSIRMAAEYIMNNLHFNCTVVDWVTPHTVAHNQHPSTISVRLK